jgi:uncharacterized OB-fold protein
MGTRLIADDIFQAGEPPCLIGGRHRETGRIVFPCPSGPESALYDRMPLSTEGKLWSWTIQRFRPKTPPYAGLAAFEPFALGYVALADQVIVETRLDGISFDALCVDMPLTLTLIPFSTDPDGTTVLTYAFRPVVEIAA